MFLSRAIPLLWLFVTLSSPAWADLRPRAAQEPAVQEDLGLLLSAAKLPESLIRFSHTPVNAGDANTVRIDCNDSGEILLDVRAVDTEWAPTFYLGLQKMGFLFPHPRMQISPDEARIRSVCGNTFQWDPRLKFRGFHLHTQHPNEWVKGFLKGDRKIAEDTIRWLARNGQNVVNVVLLRMPFEEMAGSLREPYELAHRLGLLTGIDTGFTSQQQKAYRLIDVGFLSSLFGIDEADAEQQISDSIEKLVHAIPFDYLSLELGTSEFTSSNYGQNLLWMETARRELEKSGKSVFFKSHVSINQTDPKYGNFNFLPQYVNASAGVWPHTVMFYGLEDPNAPVYGRRDFADMAAFMLQENSKRMTWYFPETSYFIAMDIDVPLLLTDYLLARSRDMDYLEEHGIQGQICFTTGQELGYWLLDWTVALLANRENRGNPLIALDLLGERREVWQPILDFQNRFFKNEGLLSVLSSSTLLDEIPGFSFPVYDRIILRKLKDDPEALNRQILVLREAVSQLPDVSGIRNDELRAMLEVTLNRVRDALALREALLAGVDSAEGGSALARATAVREASLRLMRQVVSEDQRYPEASIFSEQENPTSYAYGYGWPAATLHFWDREEKMIQNGDYSPFFMNLYDPLALLF